MVAEESTLEEEETSEEPLSTLEVIPPPSMSDTEQLYLFLEVNTNPSNWLPEDAT
jgi:hypothetical protein